jgi:type II restriction/modification system DNA methylase subunit YeeA
LGRGLLRSYLGDEGVEQLFAAFDGSVSAESDLVCYWFKKACDQLNEKKADAVGLVATNSIRGGANRTVLDEICKVGRIYNAWSDQPWVLDGAAVRVSIVCCDRSAGVCALDGRPVETIRPDLSAGGADLTKASELSENKDRCLQGSKKVGPFDVPGELARQWLAQPKNPNGRSNADVLFPYLNGFDITRRPRDMWIVDFGLELNETEAALFQAPFEYVRANVKPLRDRNRRGSRRDRWWRHGDAQPKMRRAIRGLPRYIVKPALQKHFFFAFLYKPTLPDCQLMVIARSDDTTFGIVSSRAHELWSLRLGSSLEDRPRYTPTTTFETFPFPEGLTPDRDYVSDPRGKAIAKAAARLNELRENWLNPPDLVKRVPEVVPTVEQLAAGAERIYPDRILPLDDKAAAILKKRTLTNLYNERPAWLDAAHRDLDAAVAAAYGWPADLTDEQILERLFALNQQRAAAQS